MKGGVGGLVLLGYSIVGIDRGPGIITRTPREGSASPRYPPGGGVTYPRVRIAPRDLVFNLRAKKGVAMECNPENF